PEPGSAWKGRWPDHASAITTPTAGTITTTAITHFKGSFGSPFPLCESAIPAFPASMLEFTAIACPASHLRPQWSIPFPPCAPADLSLRYRSAHAEEAVQVI